MVKGQVWVYSQQKQVYRSQCSCDLCQDGESPESIYADGGSMWLHEECWIKVRDTAIRKGLLW